MNLLFFISVITLLFIVYVECSVGNILFRVNSEGLIAPHISSMLSFMIHPFHNTYLWTPSMLDINYPFVMMVCLVIYVVFNLQDLSMTTYHNERPL